MFINTINVKTLPISYYISLWHKLTRRPGFDSERFKDMLRQFKFHSELLTEDEINAICKYAAFYFSFPVSIIDNLETDEDIKRFLDFEKSRCDYRCFGLRDNAFNYLMELFS